MIVKYLHQRLPVPMVVLEHDDPQVMVLARFYCFQRDLSFLFSLRNILIWLAVNCSAILQFVKLPVNDFV